MRTRLALVAGTCAAFVMAAAPAFAQKQGGTLSISHRDNPPSASIHEESTISVNQPFMAVFNNLVMFDPKEKVNSPDHIVPDLAESWSWNADQTQAHLQAAPGREVARRQAVHRGRREVHLGRADRATADEKLDIIRKNPRKIWYINLKDVTTNGDIEVTFVLGRPQPSFLTMLAGGYSPVYSCHVPGRDMRSKPIGTGPFKVVDFKRNESIKLVRTPTTGRRAGPISTPSTGRSCPTAARACWASVAGEFDMTFDSDVTFPLLKDVKAQKPDAVCEARPTNVSSNLLVNRDKQPFDNADIRKAHGAGARPQGVQRHPEPGQRPRRRGHAAAAAGFWGMPKEMLPSLLGHSPDIEKSRPRRAR